MVEVIFNEACLKCPVACAYFEAYEILSDIRAAAEAKNNTTRLSFELRQIAYRDFQHFEATAPLM